MSGINTRKCCCNQPPPPGSWNPHIGRSGFSRSCNCYTQNDFKVLPVDPQPPDGYRACIGAYYEMAKDLTYRCCTGVGHWTDPCVWWAGYEGLTFTVYKEDIKDITKPIEAVITINGGIADDLYTDTNRCQQINSFASQSLRCQWRCCGNPIYQYDNYVLDNAEVIDAQQLTSTGLWYSKIGKSIAPQTYRSSHYHADSDPYVLDVWWTYGDYTKPISQLWTPVAAYSTSYPSCYFSYNTEVYRKGCPDSVYYDITVRFTNLKDET